MPWARRNGGASVGPHRQAQGAEAALSLSRVARSPDLLICWRGPRLFVQDVRSGRRVLAAPAIVSLLDVFGRPTEPEAAARKLPGYEPRTVARGVRELIRLGFLVPEAEHRKRGSLLATWKHNLASAFYQAACRDLQFLERPSDIERYLKAHVASQPRPRRFKHHPDAAIRRLPRRALAGDGNSTLDTVLARRRTTRAFSRRPVALEDLAHVVRGTWGRTGTLVDPVLGRLTTKTSPSAGGLHPVECYILAWNVRSLRPGIYHYDVAEDHLRRLRSGTPRQAAIKAASGQSWVGGAAFLCVMTAVFTRTLWKYAFESAYRTLWLDAGHLGQTFSLLATAKGLGPFTTAAIQDTHIEALLGLDPAKEFPVYLCGAGVPARAPEFG